MGDTAQTNKSCLNILAFDSLTAGKDWSKLKNLQYDGKRLKWTGELDCLKKFIECFVVGEGKWRSPGGSTKQFLSLDTDQTITWYAHILG